MIPEIKDLKNGSRKTVSLTFTEEEYSSIKHLFTETGIPISRSNVTYSYDYLSWTLYSHEQTNSFGVNRYYIYGICGDYTFGYKPWHHPIQYSGNIRAARNIYPKFIEQYFINQPEPHYEIY